MLEQDEIKDATFSEEVTKHRPDGSVVSKTKRSIKLSKDKAVPSSPQTPVAVAANPLFNQSPDRMDHT